ncbi:MAG: cytochrome c biogenesis protein CcdA [Nitriliruptorales bacterium]|nr:cytochrome c biogenesis protein CcdA [Nitriliruptorales bacterium]
MADVTYLAAFGGGVISFLSPCVLPIVPGYLSVVTGVDITREERDASTTLAIARDTGLFVAGFGAVFVLLGLTATTVGRSLFDNQELLARVSGGLLLVMGLYLFGSLLARAPWLYGERRMHPDLSRFGPFAAPIAGVAFGFGWTPCIGPVLTSVLAVAATREGTADGAILLGLYSLGLGLPFLATGLAFGRFAHAWGWVKRHVRTLTMVTAGSLVVFGGLLVAGQLLWVTTQLQNLLNAVGLEELVFLG